jgi:hypothetical protein
MMTPPSADSMTYRIVSADTDQPHIGFALADLERRVNIMINAGWTPVGPPSVVESTKFSYTNRLVMQAMLKETP